jgi:hypothetical protein
MTARCPSDLALELLLAEPERSPSRDHAEGCADCQARLAEMRRQGEAFLQYVYPATVAAVEQAAAHRPAWSPARWLAPIPALAAAAAILVLARPGAPPEDYLGMKGGDGLGLAVYVQGAAGPHLAHDGEAVAAAAALRFKVRPGRPCNLWLLSIDGAGQVSRLFPADGDGGAEVSRTVELPGGAMLDGQAGPERILALCAPQAVAWSWVEGVVRQAATGGAETVRALRSVPGLPAGTAQDSLLLEKAP